jgi:shikimate dehydrogenase
VDGTATAFPPAPGTWDVLVNATPNGMSEDDVPLLSADEMRGGRLVYDLVYAPPRTRLLREAERAGCRALGGLPMLVAQAERQFEWWTGERPRPGLFAAAAAQALARRT